MYYKEYGNTGMKVSAVGLGGMRYDADDIREKRLEKCAEIPLYAFEKGINYWDTAPFYCGDLSEEITGIALSQVDRSKVIVSSKTNYDTIGTDKPDKDAFRRRLELSLKRLRTDYIDVYHLWCLMDLKSWEGYMDTIYRFFEDAKAEGLIRHICYSTHMQGSEDEVVASSGKFAGMLIGYNALNYRFRQSGILKAWENGMGVVVMNPLGGGTIPQNPHLFSYLTEGTDLTVAQAAMRFVASHREVSVALAGCTTKEHVDDAVKAVEGLQEAPAADIIKTIEGRDIQYHGLCTGCGYCKGCPVNMEIPRFMDSYNQKILTGIDTKIMDRLKIHWEIPNPAEKAAECIACGKCEKECTQHLPIIERLKEIASM